MPRVFRSSAAICWAIIYFSLLKILTVLSKSATNFRLIIKVITSKKIRIIGIIIELEDEIEKIDKKSGFRKMITDNNVRQKIIVISIIPALPASNFNSFINSGNKVLNKFDNALKGLPIILKNRAKPNKIIKKAIEKLIGLEIKPFIILSIIRFPFIPI